jgi:formyl-CoA transferase
MWPAVVKILGSPELAEDPRFKTLEARWENRAALDAIIGAWTRQRSKHEVMRLMGDAGVPCGACQDTGEVLADPHLRAREMIVDVEHPSRGSYLTVGCPIKLSDSPVAVSRPPLLGEHSEALLGSLCGVGPADMAQLRKKGVV